MEFIDRKSTYPNRYNMTDENGRVSQIFLERADEPITEGTPLNAETFNALLLCSESAEHPGCYYHTVDGEAEWLNPPMMKDIVYRTTKRFNGYPIYTVAAIFHNLDVAGKTVSKTFVNGTISKVLSISTTYYPKDTTVFDIYGDPFTDSNGIYAVTRMTVNDVVQEITIKCVKDMDEYSAVCVVEFTKAEEAL